MGSSVLGAFLGRKAVSKADVSRAATAAKAASRAAQQRDGASQVAGSLESLRQKYTDLQSKFQLEIEKLDAALRPEALVLEPAPVRPRKTDITVERVVLAWMPYHVGDQGRLEAAY
jgi:Skp family chaperone for outer membrane proteins